jgi:hypothetical protein
VENVKGAQKWIGSAKWPYRSFYLWGDVPGAHAATSNGHKGSTFRFDGNDWFGAGHDCSEKRRHASHSDAASKPPARIAIIPFPLASWIGELYKE